MGCDSWVFVHKHIADAEDGNGRVIERKVLWNYSSWEIGQQFTDTFDLPNGTYRSTCPGHLIAFADDCLGKCDSQESEYEYAAYLELKELLQNTDPSDNYFVSVDW